MLNPITNLHLSSLFIAAIIVEKAVRYVGLNTPPKTQQVAPTDLKLSSKPELNHMYIIIQRWTQLHNNNPRRRPMKSRAARPRPMNHAKSVVGVMLIYHFHTSSKSDAVVIKHNVWFVMRSGETYRKTTHAMNVERAFHNQATSPHTNEHTAVRSRMNAMNAGKSLRGQTTSPNTNEHAAIP